MFNDQYEAASYGSYQRVGNSIPGNFSFGLISVLRNYASLANSEGKHHEETS